MEQAKESFQLLDSTKQIIITSHKSADGDSIGSSMALYRFLKKKNFQVSIVHPDKTPDYLLIDDEIKDIVYFDSQLEIATELIVKADVIFCLDYNASSRLGDQMGEDVKKASAKKIMIDHHLNPEAFCDFTFSQPEVCSTAQMIYEYICALGCESEIDAAIGSMIYMGIMTDTGSFRFPSVSKRTHEIAASLLEKGVKHFEIHEGVFDNMTLDRLKLRSFALSQKLHVLEGKPVAYASLSQAELTALNYIKGDTEGIVNQILGIQGVKMAAFFMENDGKIKISFRSKQNIFVNVLAGDYFEGGGHAYAAGGASSLPLEQAIELFVTKVENYLN